jgi:hypothetical protein
MASSITTRLVSRAIRWAAVVLMVGAGLLSPHSAAAATPQEAAALEYKVKAGYLFNFARYIEWPTNAFPAADSPFIIAVLDGTEAGPVIEQVLGGKSVNGHPVQVKSVSADSLPKNAHILLVTRAAGKTPEEIREALGTVPILLVGETDQFAERGGAIAFVRAEESVRLTLCLEHAVENNLKVSARLSNVAKSVKSKRNK